MNAPLNPVYTPDPKLSPIDTGENDVIATIGMLSSAPSAAPLLLSLKQIEEFVDKNVAVLIQRGLGAEQGISDYQFTEYGADIMEDVLPVIALSNLILKYDPFTVEEIFFLKNKQIIISNALPEVFTNEMAQFLHEKKITALGINFLIIENFQLQDTVKQMVSSLLCASNMNYAIQLNPLFLKSTYCYNGDICNRRIAEHAGVPWKDLTELCWNWN